MLLKSEISRVAELQAQLIRSNENSLRREALDFLPALSKHALIITGIRRCGKSTLLSQLITERYPGAFYLNFDDNRLYGFDNKDFERLDGVINDTGSRVLFFDELQDVSGWERYVRQKLDEGYTVVLTGSNATLLSRDLGTLLTGRHISKEIFPFSFAEFTRFGSLPADENSVCTYLSDGGFPEFLKNRQPEIPGHLFDDILIRDIAVRYGIRDLKSLQRLALFLVSNIGKPVTGSKLKHSVGISATSTILEYFSFLEASYLFSFVPRFSYSVRAKMINPRKVYVADPGLITVNSNSFSDDSDRKLENAVFIFLRSQYREIYYYLEKKECDFILLKRTRKPKVIQVCHTLGNDNLERELDGLFEAMNFFKLNEGTIVTLNQNDKFRVDGLTASVVSASEFLTTGYSGSNP